MKRRVREAPQDVYQWYVTRNVKNGRLNWSLGYFGELPELAVKNRPGHFKDWDGVQKIVKVCHSQKEADQLLKRLEDRRVKDRKKISLKQASDMAFKTLMDAEKRRKCSKY